MLITIAVELYLCNMSASHDRLCFYAHGFHGSLWQGRKHLFWTHSARALQAHETGGVMLASQGRTSLDDLWVDPPTGLPRICCLPAMVMVCCVSVSMEKSLQVRKMRYEGFWEGRPNLSAPAVGCGITARRHYAVAEGASLVAVCRSAGIKKGLPQKIGPKDTPSFGAMMGGNSADLHFGTPTGSYQVSTEDFQRNCGAEAFQSKLPELDAVQD